MDVLVSKFWFRATLVAGVLDLAYAMALTKILAKPITPMLGKIATGMLGERVYHSAGSSVGAGLGVLCHFVLMGIMTAGYIWLMTRVETLASHPYTVGVGYGVATYVAMNLIAVPLRFSVEPNFSVVAVSSQLFAHVFLVGIPFSLLWVKTFSQAP